MSRLISDLGIIHHLQKALNDLEITVATEIQEEVIPVIIDQKEDLVALAKTGTGKTAAFGLPLRNHLATLPATTAALHVHQL